MLSMTPTQYRDQVAQLAKTDTVKAAQMTEKIEDPWFQAQAWAHVARYAAHPLVYTSKAAKAATMTKDDYQRSAVRAWEIAALAERDHFDHARQALASAVDLAKTIENEGSMAEALMLLFQAALKISKEDAEYVANVFDGSSAVTHWRAKRAQKQIALMLKGTIPPREFFW